MKGVEGIEVNARRTLSGVRADVTVKEGVKIKNPVHLCFGSLIERDQKIKMDIKLERGALASFIAHCIFPKVRHIMDAAVDIGEGAKMRYSETHYHGLSGGIEVDCTRLFKHALGSRGMRWVRGMPGGVARNDLGHADCSVLICKAKQA
jgi:Fe-S cluster assembly scaffold protein SufB